MGYLNLGEKIKEWRLAEKLSVPQFADQVGTSRQNIENLEQGDVDNPRYMAKLAKALQISVDELLDLRRPIPSPRGSDGDEGSPLTADARNRYKIVQTTNEVRTVPILNAPPTPQSGTLGEPQQAYGYGITNAAIGDNGYALKVKGSSMLNPHGSPSFPEGCLIFVNPDLTARPGSFVVVKLDGDDGFTFKRLTIDAGNRYLESLNPRFEILPMAPNTPILGVVVSMGMDVPT